MTQYLSQENARARRDAGDRHLAETLSAMRVSIAYEPTEWETQIVDDRLAYYRDIEALGNFQQGSKDRLTRFVLSFESVIRRKGYVAFPIKKDAWIGKMSDRIPRKFLKKLVELRLLVAREIQVSKKPNVFDATQELVRRIPALPNGESEGKNKSDRNWQPIEIRRDPRPQVRQQFDAPPNPMIWHRDQLEQEMLELNQWLEVNRERIEGVDDLRFHRVFHDSPHWGGRLYGGFTSMDRELDRPRVRIDEQETGEADLNGSYLSFFLLLTGFGDPPEDPYQHGELANYNRAFVKRVFLRLFGKGSWWVRSYAQALNPIKGELGYPEGLPNYTNFQEATCRTYPMLEDFDRFKPTLFFERYESRALLNTLHW